MTKSDPCPAKFGTKSEIVHGDSLRLLQCLPSNSVNAIVTDPPYGINVSATRDRAQMDTKWDQFSDGQKFQDWVSQWGKEAFRVLKPGGSILSFGGSRMYHRLASGLEDIGFHTKDMIEWLYYTGFPKNTRQLKPSHEPIYWGVKQPNKNTIINVDANRIPYGDSKPKGAPRDWNKNFWQVGKSKTDQFPDYKPNDKGRFPSNTIVTQDCDPAEKACRFLRIHDTMNVAEFTKPSTAERAESHHPTTKPVNLMQWLTRLVTNEGDFVIDPFAGSGTTCAAAIDIGRKCTGIELDPTMAKNAQKRIEKHLRSVV